MSGLSSYAITDMPVIMMKILKNKLFRVRSDRRYLLLSGPLGKNMNTEMTYYRVGKKKK